MLALRKSVPVIRQIRGYIVTAEHAALKNNLEKLIVKEINPHCAQWEKDTIFPAHKVFKLLGQSKFSL